MNIHLAVYPRNMKNIHISFYFTHHVQSINLVLLNLLYIFGILKLLTICTIVPNASCYHLSPGKLQYLPKRLLHVQSHVLAKHCRTCNLNNKLNHLFPLIILELTQYIENNTPKFTFNEIHRRL